MLRWLMDRIVPSSALWFGTPPDALATRNVASVLAPYDEPLPESALAHWRPD
jgi:hypothetical protein